MSYRRIVGRATVALVAIGLGVAGWTQMSSVSHDVVQTGASAPPTTASSQTSTPTQWLLPGMPPASSASSDQPTPNVTIAAPDFVTTPDGDESVSLAGELREVPSLAHVALIQTSSVSAQAGNSQSEVAFANGLTITRQQLTAPLYIDEITFGSPQDAYEQLANGYEVLTVRHSSSFSQIVYVNPSGEMTILLSTLNATTQAPPTFSPSDLRTIAQQMIALE